MWNGLTLLLPSIARAGVFRNLTSDLRNLQRISDARRKLRPFASSSQESLVPARLLVDIVANDTENC